ncbi:ATP-grasp domain-containing protein [Mesorhizobium sp. M0514]|uniref:ATP-grasp domain-containing protein n=1 Tax=Mesorhizobium sp. M0514 TaxID=2956955 RepID=UPI00333CB327
MRIAVVWNDDDRGVINRFGQPCPEAYDRETIESVAAALQEGGHETLLCGTNKSMFATPDRFMAPECQTRPLGLVFNMAYGIQGEWRLTHVPAMLEMAGSRTLESGPLEHGLALDKVITKRLIRDRGLPTPNFRVMRHGTESTGELRFPMIVKPRHESDSCGVQLVHEAAQLRQALEVIVTRFAQDALVEEYIEGREIWVALLGNEKLEVLPLVEQDFGDTAH